MDSNVEFVRVGSDGAEDRWGAHNLVVNQGLQQLCSLSAVLTLSVGTGFTDTVIGTSSQAPAAGDTNCIAPVQTVSNARTKPSLLVGLFSSSHTGLNTTIREAALKWSGSSLILARVTVSDVVLQPQDTLYVRWTVSFS